MRDGYISGVELLVKTVKSMHVTLHLRRGTSDLKPDGAFVDAVVKQGQRLHPDILQGMLDAGDEIWNELGD